MIDISDLLDKCELITHFCSFICFKSRKISFNPSQRDSIIDRNNLHELAGPRDSRTVRESNR